jgi:hypothetical protein
VSGVLECPKETNPRVFGLFKHGAVGAIDATLLSEQLVEQVDESDTGANPRSQCIGVAGAGSLAVVVTDGDLHVHHGRAERAQLSGGRCERTLKYSHGHES